MVLRTLQGLILAWFGACAVARACPAKNDFDMIVKAVSEKFYDKGWNGLNWRERTKYYRDKLDCAASPRHVAGLLNDLLGELKTSHTAVYTEDDLEYWAFKSIFSGNLDSHKIPFTGIWPSGLSGEVYARNVLDASPAALAGVRQGDRLFPLNANEYHPIPPFPDHPVFFGVSHNGDTRSTVKIQPVSISVQAAFLNASRASEKVLTFGGKKFGYFHLWSGTHEKFLLALNDALERFKRKKVDGLIVDLRDGFGGADPSYLKAVGEDPFYHKLPRAFLINSGVRSGKEWLAAIVRRDHLGILVGEKTAGAFIAGSPVKLPTDKYFLYVAVKEFNPPGIPKLEGVGVSPDVIAENCVRLCDGRDPILQRALEKLTE